jgi:hypothetical protein
VRITIRSVMKSVEGKGEAVATPSPLSQWG